MSSFIIRNPIRRLRTNSKRRFSVEEGPAILASAKSQRFVEKKRSSISSEASARSGEIKEIISASSPTVSSSSSFSVVSTPATSEINAPSSSATSTASNKITSPKPNSIRAAAALMGKRKQSSVADVDSKSSQRLFGAFLDNKSRDQEASRRCTVGESSSVVCENSVSTGNSSFTTAAPKQAKKDDIGDKNYPACHSNSDDNHSLLFAPRRIRPQLNRGGQFLSPSASSASVSLNNDPNQFMTTAEVLYESILDEFNDSARSFFSTAEATSNKEDCQLMAKGKEEKNSIPGPQPLSSLQPQVSLSGKMVEMTDLDRMTSTDILIHRYEQIAFQDSSLSLLADMDQDKPVDNPWSFSKQSLLPSSSPASPSPSLMAPPSPFPSPRGVRFTAAVAESSKHHDSMLTLTKTSSSSHNNNSTGTDRPALEPSKSGARPMLTRGGVISSPQETYFGRSTRNLLGDYGQMLDTYHDILDEFNDSTRSVQRKERLDADKKVGSAAAVAESSSPSSTSPRTAQSTPSKKQVLLDTVATNDEDKEDDTANKQEVQVPISKKLKASSKRQSKRRLASQTSRLSLVLGQQGGTTPAVPMTQAFHGQSGRELISNYNAADGHDDNADDRKEPVAAAKNKSSSNNRHDDGRPKKSFAV